MVLGYIEKPSEQASKQHPSLASVGCQEMGLGTLRSQESQGEACSLKHVHQEAHYRFVLVRQPAVLLLWA